MSANQSTSLFHKHKEDSTSHAKESLISELDSLDIRLSELKDEILPTSPYLLTVPTDAPFRIGNRVVSNWAVGKNGPFTPEEQQLQYMTFLMHHETDTLLVAVGDWSDKAGNIMAKDDSKPPSVASAASTPLSAPTKKKISLSDYKTKAKGVVHTSSSSTHEKKREAISGAETIMGAQHSSIIQSADRTSTPTKHVYLSSEPEAINRVSGQLPIKKIFEKKVKLPRDMDQSALRSPKRPRIASPRSITMRDLPPLDGAGNGLPALLSPTLPPSSTSPKVPELLSPTLPPDIEEELARLGEVSPIKAPSHRRNVFTNSGAFKDGTAYTQPFEHKRPHSESVSSSSTQSTNIKKAEQTSNAPFHGPFRQSNSNSMDHVNIGGALQLDEKQSSLLPVGIPTKSKTSSINGIKNSNTTNFKKKLIVKLKYGKANKRRVEALLKFSGKKKISTDSMPSRLPRNHETLTDQGEEDLIGPHEIEPNYGIKFRDKKPRTVENDDTPEPSGKRPKAVTKMALSDKSRTPVSAAFKSPSLQQQPIPVKPLTAPKKEARGDSVLRMEFGDIEAKTPRGSSTKPMPSSADKVIKFSPPHSSNASRSRDNDRRAWRDEYQKYADLGRDLKHAADRYTRSRTTSENVAASDEKLAAATAVEAILCFILAFVADGRSKTFARQVGDSSTWLSILPYWRVVKMTTASYPHLHGLCLLLGAISHDAIHSLDLEHLAICSFPGEHSPVPTPGSDGNTVTPDESKKYRKEFFELKSRLPEYYKEAHRLWLDGIRELSDEVLVQEFPGTWSRRSRNFAERGKERLIVGKYSGDFFLPLGRTTTPLEAVRFGVSVLGEWCHKHGLAFKARLAL